MCTDLNRYIKTSHCEYDHQDRWAILRKVTENNLGEIAVSAYDGRGYVCISTTGVYAVVNFEIRVLVTAYLPTVSKARRVYALAGLEMPDEMVRILRQNERRSNYFMRMGQ